MKEFIKSRDMQNEFDRLLKQLAVQFNAHQSLIRKQYAEDLINARKKLHSLKARIQKERAHLQVLHEINASYSEEHSYPSVPTEKVPFDRDIIPSSPGVYFFWSNDVCVYVGKSDNLRTRLVETRHEHKYDIDLVSFLVMEHGEAYYCEKWFIAILRPCRNIG